MFKDPKTGELVNGVKKTGWRHDALIDIMIAEPQLQQRELAKIFDRTEAWISTLINSDAFQARLAERREEVVNPDIAASVEERLRALADISLQRLIEKIATPVQVVSDQFLLDTAKMSTASLGYGARAPAGGNINVGVVVQVPQKATSAAEWVSSIQPPRLPE